MTARPEIELLITDVDNTLYDWVRSWAAAVAPMIHALERRLGIPAADVESRIRRVHADWGATECPACVRVLEPDGWEEIAGEYDRAFVASAPVFPGVEAALTRVREAGARVVAYTESAGSFTHRRLALLGLDGLIDSLYARAEEPCWSYARQPFGRAIPVARERLKPDPEIILTIARDAGVPPRRVAYVGDNLWKDVSMAVRAGVHSAWAQYGTVRGAADEALLARLCHWRPDETLREHDASASVRPDVVLTRRLDELFVHFAFASR